MWDHNRLYVIITSFFSWQVYPIWLCPHRLFKHPMRNQIYPEPGFEYAGRPGDTPYAQMYTDVGVYYTPRCVFKGEEFDGVAAVKKMEQWLIENHSFQPQYAVSELNERDFWRMFDGSLYQKCRDKYKAVGTFMSGRRRRKWLRKKPRSPRMHMPM
jgi:delta24-sterol reductase